MKPHRASAFVDAVPVDGRGHRLPSTTLRLAIRDYCLCEAARRFCVGMSDRAAARYLRQHLLRYQTCKWRRSRVLSASPPEHEGRIEALLWMTLRMRDYCPSERLIREVLRSLQKCCQAG